MAKKKLTRAERDEMNARHARVRANAERTRELAERAQAELLRVAAVPGAREHDGGRALPQLCGDVERVEEEDALPGVDGVGGDHPIPRLARGPRRMRRLPLPDPGRALAHGGTLPPPVGYAATSSTGS
jgi:hypothetical protein